MRRTIFTDADRVVSKNINIGKLRQRCQPDGSTAIIREDEKGCARCAEQSVIGDPVEDRTHPMFANAEPNVAPGGRIAPEVAAVLDVVHCRSVQIGAAADQQGHRLRNRL